MSDYPIYTSRVLEQRNVPQSEGFGLIQKVTDYFNKPLPNFRQLPEEVARLNRKTNVSSIAPKIISALSNAAQAVSIVFTAVFKGSAATETQSPARNKAMRIAGCSIGWAKVGSFAMVARGVVELAKQTPRLFYEPIDASLVMMKTLSDMGFSASTAISGLQQVGVISSVALKIIPVLNIVAAGLSVAEFFQDMRMAYFHKKNVVNLTWKDELKDVKRLFREVRKNHEPQFFEKAYGVDSRIMRKHLRQINNEAKVYLSDKANMSMRIKGRNMIEQTLENLKSRSKMNVHQSQMSMIAAVVGTIALLIIAFSPLGPLAVLGFSMLALSAFMYAINKIDERVAHHRFLEAMRLQVD